MVLEPLAVPLEDVRGQLRVRGTRVPFHHLVYAYREGATAEAILEAYPTVRADDLYALLAYYLRHRDEVDTYTAEQERLEEEMREKVERDFPAEGLREQLLARRGAKK